MLIKITRRRKPNKVSKAEFQITKLVLDYFDTEYEEDFSINVDESPLWCGEKLVAFPEHYSYINSEIPKDMVLFRPLKNERHSNILIDMFEDVAMNMPMDSLEINEFLNDNGKKRFTGYMIVGRKKVKESVIKSSPSIPILKTSIIAKLLFSRDDYETYKTLLKDFLYEQRGDCDV